MPRLLYCRPALAWLPVLRSRLAATALALCLLSFALPATLLLAPPLPAMVPGTPVGVAVGAAGRVLITTFAPNGVVALDGERHQLLGGAAVAGAFAGAMATDLTSGHVYVANPPSSVAVLVGANLTPLATIPLDHMPVALAANPATGRVYVATRDIDNGHSRDEVVVLDDASGSVLATIPIGAGPLRVAVDPAANLVYVADNGGDTVTLLSGADNARVAALPVGRGPHDLAVDERTGRAYVSNADDASVSVLDGRGERVLATLSVGGYPGAVAVNPRTNRVYLTDAAGAVVVLDGAANRLLARVPIGREPTALAVDTVANRVYAADALDGTIWTIEDHRWGPPTARVIARGAPPVSQAGAECGC